MELLSGLSQTGSRFNVDSMLPPLGSSLKRAELFNLPRTLGERLDNPPIPAGSALVSRWQDAHPKPAPPEPYTGPPRGNIWQPVSFEPTPDGYFYAIPGQTTIGSDYAMDRDVLMRRLLQLPRFSELLDQTRPPFQLVDTPKEIAHTMQTRRIEADRKDRFTVQDGVTSIGAPSSLSGPTAVSGPTAISGPSHTVSGPPLPLNRRLDNLGRGGLLDGDLDGPFDVADYRALAQMLRESDDRAFNSLQGRLHESYAAEDVQAAMYQQSLQKMDNEFARDAQTVDRIDAANAFAFSSELADSNQHAADVEYYEGLYRLGVDLGSAYERSREIDASGLAETGIAIHAMPLDAPAGVAESVVEGGQPVDITRASPEAIMVAGCYPVDRPADAIFSAPMQPVALNPAAVTARQELSRHEQSPLFHTQEAHQADLRATVQPATPQDAAAENRSARPRNVIGLNSMALAPLGIGISFSI